MQRTGLFKMRLGITLLKKLFLVLSASLFLACIGYAQELSIQVNANSSDDVGYLGQYGNWIDVQPYGSVWQPSVSSSWRPFTYGHWVWTDAGWAWVSYEPYGWMVYHYGNWDYQPSIGWFWIEGRDWSPARVQWRNYDGYSSWAPMPPPGREWQDPWQPEGPNFWVVVSGRNLDRDNIGHYRIGRPPLPRGGDRSHVSHEPLPVHDFEKISGRTVATVPLRQDPAPVYQHPRQGEAQHGQKPPEQVTPQNRETHPGGATPPGNPPVVSKPVQFQKMVLPQSEEARVKKYSPQVEKKVLVPKKNSKQPSGKAAKAKNTK